MEINSLAGHFFEITDVVFSFLELSPPHNSQRIGNQQHIPTRPNTTKHNQTQTHHTSQSTRTPTLSQVRAVCTQREPTGRVIIVIVAEREERRQERRKRREEKREKRRRKTPPCIDSKRLRVCVQDASVCTRKTPAYSTHAAFSSCTRCRLERTHGGVLNLHTERVFSMPSRTTPHHQQNTQNQNTKRTSHTNSQQIHHRTHQHTHTHTAHTRLLGHVHGGQPTVILRRKSECLDMCTAVNRP